MNLERLLLAFLIVFLQSSAMHIELTLLQQTLKTNLALHDHLNNQLSSINVIADAQEWSKLFTHHTGAYGKVIGQSYDRLITYLNGYRFSHKPNDDTINHLKIMIAQAPLSSLMNVNFFYNQGQEENDYNNQHESLIVSTLIAHHTENTHQPLNLVFYKNVNILQVFYILHRTLMQYPVITLHLVLIDECFEDCMKMIIDRESVTKSDDTRIFDKTFYQHKALNEAFNSAVGPRVLAADIYNTALVKMLSCLKYSFNKSCVSISTVPDEDAYKEYLKGHQSDYVYIFAKDTPDFTSFFERMSKINPQCQMLIRD